MKTNNDVEFVYRLYVKVHTMRRALETAVRICEVAGVGCYLRGGLPNIVKARSSATIPTKYTEALIEYDESLRRLSRRQQAMLKSMIGD